MGGEIVVLRHGLYHRAIWELMGKPDLLADVVLAGETRDQRLKIRPFPWPGRYATWEPYRQSIETSEGLLVAQGRDPATRFTDLTANQPGTTSRLCPSPVRRPGTTLSRRSSSPGPTSLWTRGSLGGRTGRCGAASSSPTRTPSWPTRGNRRTASTSTA